MKIKTATIEDIDQIRNLAISSFRVTYQNYNQPDIFEDYIEKSFSEKQLRLEILDVNNLFLLAHEGEDILGYLKISGGSHPEECLKYNPSLHIERIYADPLKKGQGIGRFLMETAIAEAKSKNFKSVWLGVFQKNVSAVEFYKHIGFCIAGEAIFMMGAEAQNDYIMEMPVK